MQNHSEVDNYIQNAPKEVQSKLNELRLLIQEIIPEAEEKLSYGMPFYQYKGRLVYFAHMKKHIGLYIPPPIIEQHSDDLKGYQTTKSAVHLPLDQKLPVDLIKRLVIARVKWNDEHEI